jgi:hypothetical protein
MNAAMAKTTTSTTFSEEEIIMLGKTADALSAYMGAAVLAEVGDMEGFQWVIFARVLDQDLEPDEQLVHVQMGGAGTQVLGQRGGLDTDHTTYDCEFLWAIQITQSQQERYVRLDPQGEIFDFSADLAALLPFSLIEPELDESASTSGMLTEDGQDDPDRQEASPHIHPESQTRH